MKEAKRKALRKRGWKVGDASDLLGLSEEEAMLIELKLVMARSVKVRRQGSHLSQEQFAKMLHSSQSRVAKMEAGDRSVSISPSSSPRLRENQIGVMNIPVGRSCFKEASTQTRTGRARWYRFAAKA